jgi:hypothetical protein
MAIQFKCPSCAQPIEVDDPWAGRSVACPFCEHTVTAPLASDATIATAPPTARPAPVESRASTGPESASRRPTAGAAAGGTPDARPRPFAAWALTLSISAFACLIVTTIIVSRQLDKYLPDENPTPAQFREARTQLQDEMEKQIQAGTPPAWVFAMMGGMLLTFLTWLGGLVLSIIALQYRARRRTAMAATILTALLPVMTCLSVFGA